MTKRKYEEKNLPNADIIGRIKQRRIQIGIKSDAEMCRRAGIRPQIYGYWKQSGQRSTKDNTLRTIAKTLDTTPEWIIFGNGPEIACKIVEIPIVRLWRDGNPVISDKTERIRMEAKGGVECSTLAVRLTDNGMAPKYPEGRTVLFSPGSAYEPNQVVVAADQYGGLIVRRYRQTETGEYLTADNPQYETIPIAKVTIIGRAFQCYSLEDIV